jgi:hypothetical protein
MHTKNTRKHPKRIHRCKHHSKERSQVLRRNTILLPSIHQTTKRPRRIPHTTTKNAKQRRTKLKTLSIMLLLILAGCSVPSSFQDCYNTCREVNYQKNYTTCYKAPVNTISFNDTNEIMNPEIRMIFNTTQIITVCNFVDNHYQLKKECYEQCKGGLN